MTIEEFYAGYQVEHQGTPYEKVEGDFKKMDSNGDWRLTENEFFSGMGKDHDEGDEMKAEYDDGHDEISPQDLWNKYSGWAQKGLMDHKAFSEGYRHADASVGQDTIDEHFKYGDYNGDGMLDEKEFYTLLDGMDKKEGGHRLLSI
jgi:hypothetical protein